jgi:hypothetical protein
MKKQAVVVMDQSRKSLDREQAALRQAQEALESKDSAAVDALRAAKREAYMLDLMTDASQDMAGMLRFASSPLFLEILRILSHTMLLLLIHIGSYLDAVTEEQRVNSRVEVLLRLAKQNDIDFWAYEDRTRRIVPFQDRAAQVREFRDFFGSTLAMIYNALFSRNPHPANLTELMDKFRDVESIHDFVKAQLVAGAKFALIWLRICYSKLDFNNVFDILYCKTSKRRVNADKHNEVASPVAEKMIDELLWYDAAYFTDHRYDDSTQIVRAGRESTTIDYNHYCETYLMSRQYLRYLFLKPPSILSGMSVFVNSRGFFMEPRRIN